MGMLDVLKRWFGGGRKAEPAKSAPQTRPTVPFAPTPAASASPQPVTLSINEALDAMAKSAPKPAPAKVDRREKPRVNAREGTRVLVIDDSPTIVALLKRMLEQSGYIALEATDAETGVGLALSEAPDLIFLDIVLPGMNGFEALRRLRRDPITKSTPIVMISGNELATEQFYAQRIGADDFMKKPFSRSEVFARIEKLLDEDKVPRRHLAVVAAVPTVATPAVAAGAVAAAPVAAAPVAATAPAIATAPAAVVSAAAIPAATPAAVAPVVAAPAAPVPAATPVAAAPAAPVPAATPVAPAPAAPTPAVEIPVAEILVAAIPVGASPIVVPFAEPATRIEDSAVPPVQATEDSAAPAQAAADAAVAPAQSAVAPTQTAEDPVVAPAQSVADSSAVAPAQTATADALPPVADAAGNPTPALTDTATSPAPSHASVTTDDASITASTQATISPIPVSMPTPTVAIAPSESEPEPEQQAASN